MPVFLVDENLPHQLVQRARENGHEARWVRTVMPLQKKTVMIEEHDRVVLTERIPEQDLQAGDVGTVVHIYEDGAAYEVEFFRLDGRTVAVETVPSSAIRPVAATDVTHARTRK